MSVDTSRSKTSEFPVVIIRPSGPFPYMAVNRHFFDVYRIYEKERPHNGIRSNILRASPIQSQLFGA
jgi:hypothetical protein